MSKIRIWHWITAFLIVGLLITVLLRKTFLSYKSNAVIIQNKLMELNMSISIDDAKNIAKAIRNPMWDWHYYFGFALVIMVIYRIYLEIINPKKRRDYIYLTFYIFLLFMAISGVVLYFFKIGFLKEMHEIALYFFLVFIPFHIFKNRAIIR